MIKVFKLILLLVFGLNAAYGQNGKYDVRLVQSSFMFDPCINQGQVMIDIEVKATNINSQFLVADQNYRFKYDSKLLQNPQIVTEFTLSGVKQAPGYLAVFEPHHLNGTLGDVISYNVVMSGGTGYPISHKGYTKVGRLSFDLSINTATQMKWLTDIEFPPTFIAEKVGGQKGILYEALGGNFKGFTVDSLSGNPIPKRRNQNLHLCSAQSEKIFEYSVKNGTGYDFKIVPENAGRFVSDSTRVNHVHVVFTNPFVDSVRIVAGKSFPCQFIPHLEWAVKFDNDGVMPGDVNQDGFIDWSTDATAQLYAKAQFFEHNKSFNFINSFYRPKDRFNIFQPFEYQQESFDYTCQYSQPWNADIGDLNYYLNGQTNNLKHADTNGDGILLTTTSTPNYHHTTLDLDNIWGGPRDADIIVRNHHLKTSPHPGYTPSGAKNVLEIVSLDSTIVVGQELRLLVNLGKSNFPVHDVQSIGFIVEFTYGSYKNPVLKLGNSTLGSATQIQVSDYPVLNNKTNPYWYIALSREDLSGISFTGQELCRIICEVTIAGLGNKTPNQYKNQQGEVAINVHDVVVINSLGQMTTIDGNSISIPTTSTPKNNMLRSAAAGSDFQVFPNPAVNLFQFNIPPLQEGERAAIQVFNSLGLLMGSQELTQNQIGTASFPIDGFPAGVYFVQLRVEEKTQSQRLVITEQ